MEYFVTLQRGTLLQVFYLTQQVFCKLSCQISVIAGSVSPSIAVSLLVDIVVVVA